MAGLVKGGVVVDKQEKINLENELKVDKFGAKLENIQTGASGKQLNVDGFKFDDKFGKKYHQEEPPALNNDPYGTNSLSQNSRNQGNQGQIGTGFQAHSFDYFGGSQSIQGGAPKDTGGQSKLNQKGFLDFEGVFSNQGGQTSNQGQSTEFNPFN